MGSIIFKSSLTWHVVYLFSLSELKFVFIIKNNFTFINPGFHFPQIPRIHSGTETALVRALTVGKETWKIALINIKTSKDPRLDVLSHPCFSPGSPVFLPPQKSTLLNSNSIWKQWIKSHFVEMPLQIPILHMYLSHLTPTTFPASWLIV